MNATPTDIEIARFTVQGSAKLNAAAAAAMRETGLASGLSREDAEHLGAATEAVCDDVVEQGFDHPHDAVFDVIFVQRPHEFVIQIDDQGIPGDFHDFHTGASGALGGMLRKGFADGLRVLSLGRKGNRTEIYKHRNAEDVRSSLSIDEHHDCVAQDPVSPDAHIDIRFMESAEAPILARSIYRSYGYSYDANWVYQPDQIAQRIEQGMLRSCVGIAGENEIVGHLGLTLTSSDSKVGSAGQAVVDPRYRGHHLFTSLKSYMADWAAENGMYGISSEATAAHPYSQKANLALGAHETGLLLGYIPASVNYQDIDKAAPEKRQSVTLFYLKTNDDTPRPIYPPEPHRGVIDEIFQNARLERRLLSSGEDPYLGENTRLQIQVRSDHNQAILSIFGFGPDFMDVVKERMKDFCLHRIDCIYLDLPLASPSTCLHSAELEKLGFFFGGIRPNFRPDSDVLRLQYLNNVDAQPDKISVASDFGHKLLDYISNDSGK